MAVTGFTRSRLQAPNLRRARFAATAVLLAGGCLAGPALAQDGAAAAPAPVAPSSAVQAQPLAAPDLFSIGAGTTGLPPELWAGVSPGLFRAAIAAVDGKPLSPAGAALARRILATGANAPAGIGEDAELAGARAHALMRLGDAAGAASITDRTPNLAQRPALSQAAAEAALALAQEDKACAIGDGLTTGRDGIFWLRLRAFCQARAGQAAAAQLTFDLATQQARSPGYEKLMTALLAGRKAEPPLLDDGLDTALSRRVSGDWTKGLATAAAPIAVAVARDPSAPPAARIEAAARAARIGLPVTEAYAAVAPLPADAAAAAAMPGAAGEAALIALAQTASDWTLREAAVNALLRRAKSTEEFLAFARLMGPPIAQLTGAQAVLREPMLVATAAASVGDAASARVARGQLGQGAAAPSPIDLAMLDAMIAAIGKPDGPAVDSLAAASRGEGAARARAAIAILAGLGAPLGPQGRFELSQADLGPGRLPTGRVLAMDLAARAAGGPGETALYVLLADAESAPDGPSPGDRALFERALEQAGLPDHARAYAVQGLLVAQTRR